MKKIKFLKQNKIKLDGVTYKPYTICNIPEKFGYNKMEYGDEDVDFGISEWFNYKGLTYIKQWIW